MNFIETRGNDGQRPVEVSFSSAILGPMASFGGIYVPKSMPNLGPEFLQSHVDASYKTLARDVLAAFEIDIEQDVIEEALNLYDHFDDSTNPAPLIKVLDDLYVSELYHGPTRAFKDMALQPFGLLLSSLAQKRNENYLILAATSGDTGPAALETFKNRNEDAPNLKVIGIHGDFDDAQNALKLLLSSDSFNAKLKEKHISLSAANSVNFGRIIFQLIYHIHSYLELVRQSAIELGEKIYLDVPSGNFGNALGGYYAMKMGLPVEKILIASNKNNVLTELINNGQYDLREASVVATTSPAMDILKSSNVERILYDLYGADRTKELMQQLDNEKYYQLTEQELSQLQATFSADYCEDNEGKSYINQAFANGYLMDPHTATCFKAYDSCRSKPLKTVAYSTAEWTKFSSTIANALTGEVDTHDIDALKSIAHEAGIDIPGVISELFDKEISQKTLIDKKDIEQEILAFL
jgi:threonine synthase